MLNLQEIYLISSDAEAIGIIYNEVNDMQRNALFGDIERLLLDIDINALSSSVVVSLLTITRLSKQYYPNAFDSFKQKVYESFIERHGEERTKKILVGLM